MWLALSSDGELTRVQMVRELQENQYMPVMYYEKDGQLVVPFFASAALATQFARRNTPRGFSVACVTLDDECRDSLKADGFVFEELNWPNRRDTKVHVVYTTDEVRTHVCGLRNDRVIRGGVFQ